MPQDDPQSTPAGQLHPNLFSAPAAGPDACGGWSPACPAAAAAEPGLRGSEASAAAGLGSMVVLIRHGARLPTASKAAAIVTLARAAVSQAGGCAAKRRGSPGWLAGLRWAEALLADPIAGDGFEPGALVPAGEKEMAALARVRGGPLRAGLDSG